MAASWKRTATGPERRAARWRQTDDRERRKHKQGAEGTHKPKPTATGDTEGRERKAREHTRARRDEARPRPPPAIIARRADPVPTTPRLNRRHEAANQHQRQTTTPRRSPTTKGRTRHTPEAQAPKRHTTAPKKRTRVIPGTRRPTKVVGPTATPRLHRLRTPKTAPQATTPGAWRRTERRRRTEHPRQLHANRPAQRSPPTTDRDRDAGQPRRQPTTRPHARTRPQTPPRNRRTTDSRSPRAARASVSSTAAPENPTRNRRQPASAAPHTDTERRQTNRTTPAQHAPKPEQPGDGTLSHPPHHPAATDPTGIEANGRDEQHQAYLVSAKPGRRGRASTRQGPWQ